MHIAVPAETSPGELRVSITPDSVARLVKAGHAVRVQRGAGSRAGFPDAAYEGAGAVVADGPAVYEGAQLVCRVHDTAHQQVFEVDRALEVCAEPGEEVFELADAKPRGLLVRLSLPSAT